jgi:RNA polymerase sigma-70 factor (ECF subfamily)
MASQQEITQLLSELSGGEEGALDRLLPLVEGELRRIAARHMRRENPNHTLQTTALMNDAFLKLVGQREVRWQSRAHFFALSSQIMRRILLDHARGRDRAKRGGDLDRVELREAEAVSRERSEDLIALDDALKLLAEFDPLKSRIVEMRHFGGLTVEETAEVLNVAPVTVMRHWSLAKAWLRRELRGSKNPSPAKRGETDPRKKG